MIINAVVPAKGNSTRLKDKNLQKVGGKSMTFWACERCLKTPSITNTYLDTEDNRIINDVSELIAKGLKIINRPVELASNETSGNELIVFEQKNILNPIENSSKYSEKNFSTRHHPFLAPSNGSTAEAFLKSRYSFDPIYVHNESATKYAMISTIHEKSSEIKKNILRFV